MQTNVQAPPLSNRGVQNTSLSPLRSLVDWVQVTFRFVEHEHEVYDLLGVEKHKFTVQKNGLYGYRTHYKMGHISVLSDGSAGTGIHVQMTGQGCREYEQAHNWQEFFLKCLSKQANFTRIDLAVDEIRYNDDKPFFKLSTLERKLKDDCVRSRFRAARHIETININGGTIEGHTLYFGSPQSDIQIRFYEKDYERINADFELEEGITTWNRCELQTRNDRANAIAMYIVNNYEVGKIVTGVLSSYINFLIKGNDTNKARWKVCEWWQSYLANVEKLRLTLVAPDRTIERVNSWIDKQVSSSLAMLVLAYGSDEFIKDMIVEATEKLTEEQIRLATDYADNKLEENKYIQYLKKNAYDRYLFKTGQHVLGIKKDAID